MFDELIENDKLLSLVNLSPLFVDGSFPQKTGMEVDEAVEVEKTAPEAEPMATEPIAPPEEEPVVPSQEVVVSDEQKDPTAGDSPNKVSSHLHI